MLGLKEVSMERVAVAETEVQHLGLCLSALFPDVVNCMQTDNLELKKLVYLYLMNYAKSQPDMAIMAVNTFVKVTSDQADLKQGRRARVLVENHNSFHFNTKHFLILIKPLYLPLRALEYQYYYIFLQLFHRPLFHPPLYAPWGTPLSLSPHCKPSP